MPNQAQRTKLLDERVKRREAAQADKKIKLRELDAVKPSLNVRRSNFTMDQLLNIIDGLLETPGLMFIMTTNHPEHLDPALLRPGRFDICLELGTMCEARAASQPNAFVRANMPVQDAMRRMIAAHCDCGPIDGALPDNILTPAEACSVVKARALAPVGGRTTSPSLRNVPKNDHLPRTMCGDRRARRCTAATPRFCARGCGRWPTASATAASARARRTMRARRAATRAAAPMAPATGRPTPSAPRRRAIRVRIKPR